MLGRLCLMEQIEVRVSYLCRDLKLRAAHHALGVVRFTSQCCEVRLVKVAFNQEVFVLRP